MLYFNKCIDKKFHLSIIENMITRKPIMKLLIEILQAIFFVAITFSPLWICLAMMKPL
jgi:hypothetical protein